LKEMKQSAVDEKRLGKEEIRGKVGERLPEKIEGIWIFLSAKKM